MNDFLETIKILTPTILGIAGVIITIIFSAANKKINHQRMEKELFKEFNERYDKLNETLSRLHPDFSISDLNNRTLGFNSTTYRETLIDYFNLCSEQYYWKEKGRISSEIWMAWNRGMNYYYNNFPVVKELWENETKNENYKSYYLKKDHNFFKINEELKN